MALDYPHPQSRTILRVFGRLAPTIQVPVGSPSRGGDVTVCVFDINQPSLPTPFYSVLVPLFDFMALSTVFDSKNSLSSTLLSHSVLPVFFCLPY